LLLFFFWGKYSSRTQTSAVRLGLCPGEASCLFAGQLYHAIGRDRFIHAAWQSSSPHAVQLLKLERGTAVDPAAALAE
jgi:hypothetical protein